MTTSTYENFSLTGHPHCAFIGLLIDDVIGPDYFLEELHEAYCTVDILHISIVEKPNARSEKRKMTIRMKILMEVEAAKHQFYCLIQIYASYNLKYQKIWEFQEKQCVLLSTCS